MKTLFAVCFVTLAVAVTAAPPVQDPEDYVRQLYRHSLGREPDSGELKMWVGNMYKGMSTIDLRASFLGSDEFYRNCGRDARRFVTAAFTQVFLRLPTDDEHRHWTGRYWAHNANRIATAREMIRDYVPTPPPKPVEVVVARPVLPAEPIPVQQPNLEIVAQAETAIVLLELFVDDIDRCGQANVVASLLADARRLKGTLGTVRRTGAAGASHAELAILLRDVNADVAVVRDRHRALGVAVPTLRLPSPNGVQESIDRLNTLVRY